MALLDTGEIPVRGEAEAEVPALPGRGDQGPRSGREDGAPPLRRARRLEPRRPARRRRGAADPRSSRASGRRPRRTCSRRSASSPTGRPPSGCCSPRSCRSPSSSPHDLRAHPASDAVEVAGSARRRTETCHDIDLIATASEPAALAQALLDHPLAATKGSSGESGRSDHHPQRDRGRPADRRARRLRQPAPALHRLGRAQRRAARAGGGGWALGLRARDHRHRLRGGRPLRDRGRGLRAPRARLHRARAARGQRRDRRRGRRHAAEAGRARRTSAATSTATRRSPTATTRSRRWPRPRALAATPTSRSPTTPPATASATTSPPERLRERIEEVRELNSGRRGFRVLAGSEVNILPDGSLDYDGRPARRARLGDRQRPHLVQDLRASDDRAGDRSDRAPAGRLHRPPQRAADRRGEIPTRSTSSAWSRPPPHRDDARDQRQPEPPRPLRAPRAAGRRGRRHDLRQHRRPSGGDPRATWSTASPPRGAPG